MNKPVGPGRNTVVMNKPVTAGRMSVVMNKPVGPGRMFVVMNKPVIAGKMSRFVVNKPVIAGRMSVVMNKPVGPGRGCCGCRTRDDGRTTSVLTWPEQQSLLMWGDVRHVTLARRQQSLLTGVMGEWPQDCRTCL